MKKLTDERRIEEAFVNSYNIIMSGQTVDEYIDDMDLELVNLDVIFAHDPVSDLTKLELLFIITYFEDKEEYEKCSNLNKFIKNAT